MGFQRRMERQKLKKENKKLQKCKDAEDVLRLINMGKVRGKTAQSFLAKNFGVILKEEAVQYLKDMGLWE